MIRFVILLMLCAATLTAQGDIVFRHWDEVQGLQSDQIRSFSMLDDGRMTIRIPNGLIIFDGSDFNLNYIDRGRETHIGYRMKNVYANYKDSDGRIWLKAPEALSVYDPVSSSFIYDVDSLLTADYNAGCKIDNIFFDKACDLWIVTDDNRLLLCRKGNARPTLVSRTDGEWKSRYGDIIEIAGNGDRAVICTDKGILRTWDKADNRFVACDETFKGMIDNREQKFKLVHDSKGNRWAMYDNRVWRQPRGSDKWEVIIVISGGSNFFTAISVDDKDNVWVGASWSGLRVIDGKTLDVTEYPKLPLESGDYLNNDIQEIFIDRTGGVWIGTLWQGIAYYHSRMNPFHTFHTGDNTSRRNNESVRDFIDEPDGDILVATSFNGIVRYNPATGSITPERRDLYPVDDVYMCLYRDSQGALWVGTYLHGFIRTMPDGSVQRYNYDPGRKTNISRAVFEDEEGTFWVSVNDRGVGRLDLGTGEIEMLSDKHPRLSSRQREYGIFQFAKGELCVYGENGMYIYTPSKDELFVPRYDADPEHRYHVSVNGALVDTRGLAWYATDGGIFISDPQEYGKPGYADIILTESDSLLPSNYVSTIIEDKFGQIWATTPKGIVRIIVRPDGNSGWKFDLTGYPYGGGLTAGRVSENAAFMDSDGDIYIGAYNGVMGFNPVSLVSGKDSLANGPLITGLSLFGSPIKPLEPVNGREIVATSILNGSEVLFDHDENFITIRFSSLDFISGPYRHYKYRLVGVDPDWVELSPGNEPQAVYTSIPPGTYTFEVIASGIDGVWTSEPARMTIIVEPPYWLSWWAYLIYALLGAALLATGVRLYITYKNRKLREETERREQMQREELNQMKFQFFTNISHEFRTPLALIMTPLSHILKNDTLMPELKDKLGKIYSNAENLLGQVNRLLDFRKLEMGGEKLNLSRCRVVQFVSYLISSFDNISESRHIALRLDSRIPEDTDVYLDNHKLKHVLTNLYSNAIKFTPEGGSITTILESEQIQGREYLRISVSDTGIGIAEKDLASIFDRFYQAGNSDDNPSGSGIGLHLVREYVKLHGGTITVESKPGEGTTFSFVIPRDLTGPATEPATAGVKNDRSGLTEEVSTADKRLTILIAEDNKEFRDFLSEYLSPSYNILTAVDGVDALEKIKTSHPDMLVTDLMMPRMDGIELITRLKHDIATSHIPVILLTAKATDESRIESYKVGADSYISKPFNFDVLQARIKTLIGQAESRKSQFRKDADIEPSAVTITSLDEKLLKKALETVEKNIDNSSFSAVQLGEALGLSRSQLYRKFESVTGMSPADFILRMRLKRAAQLLRDSRLNVSEIADMTGFNSIKYFNKHFKEEFAQTPTEYRSSQSQS